MTKTKMRMSLAVLALAAAAPLVFAVDVINYNGSTYRCENSCMVRNGAVRDSMGGYVEKLMWAIETGGPISP